MAFLRFLVCVMPLSSLAEEALRIEQVDERDTPFLQEVLPLLEPLGKPSISNIMASLPTFEDSLKPMVASTPRNDAGNLGRSAVRYTLNRFFIQRHGWFVNGLFTGGAKWNASSEGDLSFVQELVPPAALRVFEGALSQDGLDEKQLALLGSVIEERILSEPRDVLRRSYGLLDLPTTEPVSRAQAHLLVSIHLMRQITQVDDSVCDPKYGGRYIVRCLQNVVEQVDPNWPKTRKFLQDLQDELFPNRNELRFEHVALMATTTESRWGRWTAARNCQSIKDKLMKIEEGHNTGCVRLSAFYERSLAPEDGWQFKETPAYLRELGALDEANPKDPKILIPNYVNALANCFSSGEYYQSCCINECEGLQVQVESALQSSSPTPDEIITVVKQLSSATVTPTGDLSYALQRRLREIGDLHGGRVPLQGRMFEQWMHFAYPHECPYPHMSGSIHQVGLNLSSDAQFVTDNVVYRVIAQGKRLNHTDTTGTCTQWRREEELFVPTEHALGRSLHALEEDIAVWQLVRAVSMCSALAMVATMGLTSIRGVRRALRSKTGDFKPMYLV
eukprot:TRINITY_DN4281_c0_g1_i1.p1 TRINITY_DN4281_c0_g1~~TRINITY_DN4281_c0_g1_i1.p1  ORF type:complete len:561 (+),score=113.16 TRINITY_DN4281_c0_g1_i1:87-1769(+)